jgi:dihydroneopterin aldolase
MRAPEASMHDLNQYDVVSLNDLQINCLVGIYQQERIDQQPLVLDCDIYLERRPGQFGDALATTIDYEVLAGELRFILCEGQFRLLETAAEALCSAILGPSAPDRSRKAPAAVTLTLRKPRALAGVATPAVTIHRTRDELAFTEEKNYFGRALILHENRDCGVYRLCIPAGGAIPPHMHGTLGEAELVMSDGLNLQGEPVSAGLAHAWPNGFVHTYTNPTDQERSVLCVNRPIFFLEDEQLVAPDAPLQSVDPFRARYFGADSRLEVVEELSA